MVSRGSRPLLGPVTKEKGLRQYTSRFIRSACSACSACSAYSAPTELSDVTRNSKQYITREWVEAHRKRWPSETKNPFKALMLEHGLFVYRMKCDISNYRLGKFLESLGEDMNRDGWVGFTHDALLRKKVIRRLNRMKTEMVSDGVLMSKGTHFFEEANKGVSTV